MEKDKSTDHIDQGCSLSLPAKGCLLLSERDKVAQESTCKLWSISPRTTVCGVGYRAWKCSWLSSLPLSFFPFPRGKKQTKHTHTHMQNQLINQTTKQHNQNHLYIKINQQIYSFFFWRCRNLQGGFYDSMMERNRQTSTKYALHMEFNAQLKRFLSKLLEKCLSTY